MNLHENLRALRRKNGISQESLAEILGVSRQAVAKWENSQSLPDIENLIAIGDYFKISIDKIVKAEDLCSISNEQRDYSHEWEIKAFLCRAKQAAYAGNGPESPASRPCSHDYVYSEDRLLYMDSWLGGEKFSGEEVLWIDDEPYWTMNYTGRVMEVEFSGDFLKEALLLVSEDSPFRGPVIYQNQDHQYHCMIEGNFGWFKGVEEILHKGKKVYECLIHGGHIG
ncbi:MAG TPA: DUF5680 domain-containing protein [Thermotogota bacterium]|nr:DUF5680 domain-containing protein [Thermotogota bacterium]